MSMTVEQCNVPRQPNPVPATPNNVFDQLKLTNKVACITGTSEGIGYAVAEAYAEAGAHLALVYNSNPAAVEKAKTLAAQHNVTVRAYKLNVTDPAACEATIKQVVADFGKLDILVANAGMSGPGGILETDIASYRKQMSVNVDGVVFCAKYAGEVFKAQGFGALIITASMSARIVNVPVHQPIYNATKAFVAHFGRSLAVEWRDFARVNVVSPGFFETKMGAAPAVLNEAYRMAAMNRQGNTREIKGLYLLLASDAGSYMTGSDVVIDGGYTLP